MKPPRWKRNGSDYEARHCGCELRCVKGATEWIVHVERNSRSASADMHGGPTLWVAQAIAESLAQTLDRCVDWTKKERDRK